MGDTALWDPSPFLIILITPGAFLGKCQASLNLDIKVENLNPTTFFMSAGSLQVFHSALTGQWGRKNISNPSPGRLLPNQFSPGRHKKQRWLMANRLQIKCNQPGVDKKLLRVL